MLFFTVLANQRIVIARRFCGPPDSGNGGYSSGLLAIALSQNAECTLRKPVPIERELLIEARGDGAVLLDNRDVVIECRAAGIELLPQPPVSFSEAQQAASNSPAMLDHPFPTCFTCGPERMSGDGLRIFPGRVEGRDNLWAAPWTPDPSLAKDGKAEVRSEFVWAAMDCPTGFAGGFPWAGTLVTGRLAVTPVKPVEAERPHVIVSWPLGWEGRKSFAAAALYTASGELCAKAKATWIKLE
ncbi:MAG TPA: hypothetical protein VF493_23765 [Terriglobales bacterium]